MSRSPNQPSPPTSKLRRVFLGGGGSLLVLMAAWFLVGHRQTPGPYPPLVLTIPQADGTKTALMAGSGWPLTVHLEVEDTAFEGFGYPEEPPRLPRTDEAGYLIFEDPDGCPSWLTAEWQRQIGSWESNPGDPGQVDCGSLPLPWPRDESWLKIVPGISMPDSGRATPAEGDDEICGQRPFLWVFAPDEGSDAGEGRFGPLGSNRHPEPVGPCVGGLFDEYGYGSSERLPGLVLLADSGPGWVTDPHFDRPVPAVGRNLAGFFHSVAYEVMSADGHTRISAHLNVPRGLFTPLVVRDGAPGELCPGSRQGGDAEALRIDGGPVLCDAPFDPNQHPVTVRAFVVDGRAPDELMDSDGDGILDADDAVAAGYRLLSNSAELRFMQLHEFPEPPYLPVDLDGNREAGPPPAAPVGPGGLTPPPR